MGRERDRVRMEREHDRGRERKAKGREREKSVRERERRSLPHRFKKVRIEEGRACFTENRSVKQARKTNFFLVFC